MITPSETLIEYIKPFLLSNITICIAEKELYNEQLINFIVKDFNVKFIFSNKKIDLLYPFSLYKKNDILYFDYTVDELSYGDPLLKMKLTDFNKTVKNKKYFDKIVTIQQNY